MCWFAISESCITCCQFSSWKQTITRGQSMETLQISSFRRQKWLLGYFWMHLVTIFVKWLESRFFYVSFSLKLSRKWYYLYNHRCCFIMQGIKFWPISRLTYIVRSTYPSASKNEYSSICIIILYISCGLMAFSSHG